MKNITPRINRFSFRNIIITIIVILISMMSVGTIIYDIGRFPEKYSTSDKYQLMMSLNKGDTDALYYYEDRYIANDIYLYDGPLTVKLCCEKYGYDFDTVYEDFDKSDYDSFQKYFDRELKQ